jgi:hypothetical protein
MRDAGDFFGGQVADFAQGQRDLSVLGQGGMAAFVVYRLSIIVIKMAVHAVLSLGLYED